MGLLLPDAGCFFPYDTANIGRMSNPALPAGLRHPIGKRCIRAERPALRYTRHKPHKRSRNEKTPKVQVLTSENGHMKEKPAKLQDFFFDNYEFGDY